jgi:hypothetical protein
MRRGTTDTYPSFPEIKDQLGYNPARFLLPTDDAVDELSWKTRATAFIRGMDDVETIRAWIEVEVALEQGQNGGPRKKVIRWLNHRQAVIEGTVSKSTETGQESEASTADTAAMTATETPEIAADTAPAVIEASTDTPLAADGGATSDETSLCPDCHVELTKETIAGQTGYWCPQCRDFREPTTEVAP